MNSPLHLPPGFQYLQRRSDNKRFAELEADLMPTLTALRLDLKRSTYVGTKGNLVAFLTDVDLGARKREPALLLSNKASPTERQVHVPLSVLWVLLDPKDLSATQQQQEALRLLTERLYGFVTKDDAYRVLDAIYEFAEDLVHAKPPTWMTNAQWLQALAEDDMVLKINGEAVNG